MKTFKRTALAVGGLLLCLSNSTVQAANDEPVDTGLGWLLEAAAEFGGDDVARIYYEDGSDQSIKTGQGFTLAAGGHYRTASNWDFRGTLGYKYVTTKANNANIYIDRIVAEAVADYFFAGKWFVGGGLSYHKGPKLHSDGFMSNIEFDDAAGFTVEAGWSFVSLTYTVMDYEDEFGNKYDTNNIGVSFIGRF